MTAFTSVELNLPHLAVLPEHKAVPTKPFVLPERFATTIGLRSLWLRMLAASSQQRERRPAGLLFV